MIPVKKINGTNDLQNFKKSISFKLLHETIGCIVEAVKSTELPSSILDTSLINKSSSPSGPGANLPPKLSSNGGTLAVSSNSQIILDIISDLNQLVDATPPEDGPRRFGNFAYKTWHSKIDLCKISSLTDDEDIADELKYYLIASFGSNVRLDFGTGHELSFIAFIGILMRLKKLPSNQELLIIFAKYYDLVRRLIIDYSLEPAGSHGVWGLDDHFHFIYILGASQFNESKFYPPVANCLQDGIIREYQLTNLYINSIAFIKRIKTGPFNEHSPILFDIHNSVSLWKKVVSGLRKMYDVEVLGKFPVVQHFYFGKCYPWEDINGKKLPDLTNMEFLDGGGIKTTNKNISMTGAPWAQSSRR